jgi:hypothetical protein
MAKETLTSSILYMKESLGKLLGKGGMRVADKKP